MSEKQLFIHRYAELGWTYREVEIKPSIRINMMNAEAADVVKRLQSQGVILEKIPFLENGYWVLKSDFSVGATAEYLLGLYSIQEAAAQIPDTLFAQLENKSVLDACAAPGGKTVQLADIMRNTGAVLALDVDRRRLVALSNHLERCRVQNSVVYMMDARKASQFNLKFDRILLDVPCSGNFAIDRGWFGRRTLKDVKRNADLQRQILSEASKVLAEGGEIVYSTCSLEAEENELNVDWAVKSLDLETVDIDCYGENSLPNLFGVSLDPSVKKCKRIWPGPTQGFFVCKLRKKS